MAETTVARQRQTRAGRRAFNDQFASPAEKSAHFSALGRRSAERRLTLSGDDAEALAAAYVLLRSIANKLPQIGDDEPAASEGAAA